MVFPSLSENTPSLLAADSGVVGGLRGQDEGEEALDSGDSGSGSCLITGAGQGGDEGKVV